VLALKDHTSGRKSLALLSWALGCFQGPLWVKFDREAPFVGRQLTPR
jgi:hypothetical protein